MLDSTMGFTIANTFPFFTRNLVVEVNSKFRPRLRKVALVQGTLSQIWTLMYPTYQYVVDLDMVSWPCITNHDLNCKSLCTPEGNATPGQVTTFPKMEIKSNANHLPSSTHQLWPAKMKQALTWPRFELRSAEYGGTRRRFDLLGLTRLLQLSGYLWYLLC